MSFLKKIVRWLVPGVETSADGREKWPSRTAYILASMGGAVGVGNLLRYPSIAFENSGLQWFIAYFVALFFIGIPILAMEICFGQAYRGGTVVSFGRISRRIRGLGLSTVFIGYLAATYYVVIMSWVMTYFRNSFISPLPWAANNQKFFKDYVLRNPDPIKDPNGGFTKFPATGVIGETLGWTAMTWVLVYLCVFKGVSLTGRVVYFTMLFPLALILILTIRSVTLENSWRGIKLYIGEFHADKLFGGKMWTEAIIQIFFSIGVGFGYYAAYSSYNSQYANAVQDSVIIACSNSLIEMFAGFAAFGVLGYISNNPADTKVSTFTLGFLTYPAALARLPGSNAWSVVFFLTLYLLGIDSAFAYLEGFITVVMDTDWGKKPPRTLIVGAITLGAALLSILYTTEFGRHLFNAIDTWITAVTLMLCMWLQCSIVTSVYRYKDVLSQTGKAPYIVAQASYFASMIVGAILLQTVGGAAAGASFGGILVAGTLLAVFICKTEPTVEAPKPFNTSKFGNKFWWLTSYPGHQLSRDLNVIIAQGKNWGLPFLWAPILRWFSAPILMIILSFAYPRFATKGETELDKFGYVRSPLHIFGFVLAHVGVLIALIGIIIPNSMNVWVSDSEKYAYRKQYESEPGKVLEEVQDIEGDPNGLERKDSKTDQDSSDENDS